MSKEDRRSWNIVKLAGPAESRCEFISGGKIVVNSLIEEIHLIFGEVSVVKRKYTCATLMWSDKSSCESAERM